MRSGTEKFSDEKGATLIEVIVVLIIIVVITTFAVMKRGASNDILKRQNAAQQLKVAFERARFDSVKRRPETTASQANVTVTAFSYTLTTDRDLNGVLSGSDSMTTELIPQNVAIKDYNGGFLPQTIYYNKRGEAVDNSGNPISPTFYICNSNCNSPNNSNANVVLVTPTGTVNLLPGGSLLPTFGVPAINNVPSTTGVNPDAVVN